MKLLITILSILTSLNGFSQSPETEKVKETINGLFTAMRNSDSTGIKNALAANATFQTINAQNELKAGSPAAFITSVGKAPKGSLDERIVFGDINIDGNLATAWVPYEFYVNGNFSHCGVNSFQLHKTDGKWKIQSVLDTRRKDECVK